jgi:CubicO group peptidase (beta-lactamase class C family)
MRMRFAAALLIATLPAALFAAEKKDEPKAAQSVPELRQQLEKILKDSHTPGVSVAIVHKDGPEWVGALGLANVAANQPATADTLFRIGSTSKAFASLSILKLVDEGKLSLDDPVRKLAPEVQFENKWEATDPVRVVNLLEHTTGWDDMHLREYAKNADGMDLKTGLAFGTSSRVSRWRPGTRMSYCNTGPAVAAYIVEKITGQRFEDYVQQNFFAPLGMKTATYFPPQANAVTLYHDDGKTPYPYWHIIYRPAGSINASANDMAGYVQFYLNCGMVNGTQAIPGEHVGREGRTEGRVWPEQLLGVRRRVYLSRAQWRCGRRVDGVELHTGVRRGLFLFDQQRQRRRVRQDQQGDPEVHHAEAAEAGSSDCRAAAGVCRGLRGMV